MEPAGVFAGRDKGKVDAGGQSEDAAAGDFEDAFSFPEPVVLLTAPFEAGKDTVGIQQQTQTSRPFTKAFRLPGEGGRPRCSAT
jgi:hypothetical protein